MKLTNSLVLLLLAAPAFGSTVTKEFASQDVTEVVVENTSGKVHITGVDEPKAKVMATKNRFSENCKLTLNKVGQALTFKVTKIGLFSPTDCDVDLVIRVPKTVDLNLAVGSGHLNIKEIHGKLTFRVGSGDIVADGAFKNLDGKTGSGDVEVKGLKGGGELSSGSGKIRLTFAAADLKGDVALKTGSGDATLLFPKGSLIKTQFEAGSGSLVNEVGDDPTADFRVSMKAGSGNLNIKTY